MENLPQDNITNIFSRSRADAILCAKQVCKSWNRSIKTDAWFQKIHLNNYDDDDSPCNKKQRLNNGTSHAAAGGDSTVSFLFLAKSYGVSPKKTTYYGEYSHNDDDDDGKFLFKAFTGPTSNLSIKLTIAPLPMKKTHTLVGSCNGLVCFGVSDSGRFVGGDPIYICNPVTRQEWNLPRYNIIDSTYNYEVVRITSGFCYVPSTNQYKVVRICHHPLDAWPEDFGNLQVFTLGVDVTWRHKEYIPRYLLNFHKGPNMQPGVVADGAIHWVDYLRWKIVAFDFVDEVVLEVPTPPCFDYRGRSGYDNSLDLKVLRGCLSVVHRRPVYNGYTVDIWSFKKTNTCSCGGMSNDRVIKKCKNDRPDWSWIQEFSIRMEVKDIEYVPTPFAITKTGKILLWYNQRFLSVYDPKTATLKKLADGDIVTCVYQTIPHVNSFVSL